MLSGIGNDLEPRRSLWSWDRRQVWVKGRRVAFHGVVSYSDTDCPSSHPMHNFIWVEGTQKYSWHILDKMRSHEVDRKVCVLLDPGHGSWGVRNCPTTLRADAVTTCSQILKLIQFQDPYPASKDPLESWRQFHTWIPRHNGWALKCVVGGIPMIHWCFCFVFSFKDCDTRPLKYVNVSLSTDLFGSMKKFIWGQNWFVFRNWKKQTFQKELERGERRFRNNQYIQHLTFS